MPPNSWEQWEDMPELPRRQAVVVQLLELPLRQPQEPHLLRHQAQPRLPPLQAQGLDKSNKISILSG